MAYGHVSAPSKTEALSARLYPLPVKIILAEKSSVLAWPIECSSGQNIPSALENRLRTVFNDELEKGLTYPQRGPMSNEEFRSYFLSYDLVIGVLLSKEQTNMLIKDDAMSGDLPDLPKIGKQIQIPKDFFQDYNWNEKYAFSYYIKPNYPGRSSHLCNGGFVVPPNHRGLGLGGIAAISFLYYAPRCGYKGSVFNLVYANNEASVRIWERLGFYRVGKIPQAGLLKTADGKGQEYVDAWVIHGDFEKLGLEGILPSKA